jgi:pSer/pThr/pTyr-binding forkhead associated (FHA) protein
VSPSPSTSPAELKAQIEAEKAGTPFIVYRDEAGAQEIVTVAPGSEIWVGRGEAAGLRLGWDEEVSSLHAHIVVIRDECTLIDDGLSRNGSFVNEERVLGRRRLSDGDVLRFGRTQATFRRPGVRIAETVIASGPSAAALITPAQRNVLTALCRPYKDQDNFATPATNREIAAELFISLDAVKSHMRALFDAFGIGDLPQNRKRATLAEQALQSGLIVRRDL